jgi:hypothetical protein
VKDLEMKQLDVKGAYLNGDLQEEVFMEQPPGFDDGSGQKCRLRKTLYGLKQSGREWNRKLHGILTKHGFIRLEVDHGVYMRQIKDQFVIITVWVDDLLLFSNHTTMLSATEAALKQEVEINDLGEPKKIIGIEIYRDRAAKTIQISQEHYIDGVLKHFGYDQMSPVKTPMDPNVVLEKSNLEGKTTDERGHSFAEYMGSLIWPATISHPDIAYAVARVGAYTSSPSPTHWTAMKKIFRYLKGTRDKRITYGGPDFRSDSSSLFNHYGAYGDADFASNPDDSKSVSGYVYLLAGGPIAWHSKKQPTVALSTAEAEYSALTAASRHAIWLIYSFQALPFDFPTQESTIIYSDNQSAISIAYDPQHHTRSKHFRIENHFIRECVELGIVNVEYCPTNDMIADIFTKALSRARHEQFWSNMGLLPA